ncbi:MAG: hypothetical protein U0821_09710 [Chloroflexota bacterium]
MPAPTIVIGQPVTVSTGGIAEATVAVTPPGKNPQCPGGRLVFGSGSLISVVDMGAPVSTPSFVNLAGLLDASGDLASPYLIYDNHLVATRDGQLVYTFEGVTWKDDVSPRPSWWQETKNYPLKGKAVPGGRGAIFVFRSADGGSTWRQLPTIDAAKLSCMNPTTNKLEVGYCGFPRLDATQNRSEAGGWDGHYLHMAQATGDLFITTVCATARGYQGLVLRSTDVGQSWTVVRQVPTNFFWRVPICSLPGGTIAIAYPSKGQAIVEAASPPYNTVNFTKLGPSPKLSYPSDKDTPTNRMADRVGLAASMYAYLSLSRVTTSTPFGLRDGFRLAYYADSGGDAVYGLRDFGFPLTKAGDSAIVKSATAGRNVLQGTFVDVGGVPLKRPSPNIFFWIEQLEKGRFQVRCQVFLGGAPIGGPEAVSEIFATPSFSGDYIHGTAYSSGAGEWTFVLAWSQAGSLRFAEVNVKAGASPGFAVNRVAPRFTFDALQAASVNHLASAGELHAKSAVVVPHG